MLVNGRQVYPHPRERSMPNTAGTESCQRRSLSGGETWSYPQVQSHRRFGILSRERHCPRLIHYGRYLLISIVCQMSIHIEGLFIERRCISAMISGDRPLCQLVI